ncbi:hypothetical protein AAU57_05630 [Nonlabens sp. YIK11]|uniref:hypothetical protein n=1 Tax=Nonlabens sp. YIK11 TaxID=1453349 RepID=UPI0007079188|nr:hypothetical protein [Nonlabens sp. YIK11]KQC32851.1 hypothetical protein AAU57_05630 [Nonlabens sp. YIK11]
MKKVIVIFMFLAFAKANSLQAQTIKSYLPQKTRLSQFELSKPVDSVIEFEWKITADGSLAQRRPAHKLVFDKAGQIKEFHHDDLVRHYTYSKDVLQNIVTVNSSSGKIDTLYRRDGLVGRYQQEVYYYDRKNRLDSIIEDGFMGKSITRFKYNDSGKLLEQRETVTGILSGKIIKDFVVLFHEDDKPYAAFNLANGEMSYLSTEKGVIEQTNPETIHEELKEARKMLRSARSSPSVIESPFDHFQKSYTGWTLEEQTFYNDTLPWTAKTKIFGASLRQPLRWIDTGIIYHSDGTVKGSKLPDPDWLASLPTQLEKL